MSYRGGRAAGRGLGRGLGRGAFPARGSAPVARGNVWTRDAAGSAPAARAPPPVAPQVAGVKRPREDEAARDDAGPSTHPKPALPELQDTLSRKLQEAEALRLRIELEAQRVQQRKARLEAEQERARAAQAAAQEAEQRERSRKLQSGFAAAVQRVGAQRAAEPPAAPAATGDAARRAADDAECLRVLGALTDADALGLRPHPQPEAAKRAYRALAKRLHPDKCTAAKSSAAFQRILRAYQNLTKQ